MLSNSVRLFRILGIDVRVHVSWLIVFALVSWSLAVGYFPAVVPGVGDGQAWLLGVVAALLFFGSVLVHELSHSLVARSRGIGVESITLFIFGGVSTLRGEANRPGTEFLVAVVGPLTSLAIGGVSLLAGAELHLPAGVAAVLGYLGLVNGLLGLFNLIPGFPLDGGRVLRSAVWRATGDVVRATRIAAAAGRLVALLFFIWGLVRVFDGDLIGGVWIAAIGWFLQSAAASSVEQLAVERAARDVRVRDIFRPGTFAVRPDDSIEDAIERVLLPNNLRSVPVANGRLLGVLSVGDVGRVPRDLREHTPVAQVMSELDRLPTVRPDDSLRSALAVLAGTDAEEIPVVEDGRLVGLLSRADVLRAVQLREELDRAA